MATSCLEWIIELLSYEWNFEHGINGDKGAGTYDLAVRALALHV